MAVTINASTSSGLQLTSDTSGAIAFQNNGSTAATIDSSGNVGIGLSSFTSKLAIFDASNATIDVYGNSTTQLNLWRYSSDITSTNLNLIKARGTLASPSAVASGDFVGGINCIAYDGTNNRILSQIVGTVKTYTASNDISGELYFTTRPSGVGASLTERMRIDSNGYLLVGQTTNGFVNSKSVEISGSLDGRIIVNHINGQSSGNYYIGFGYNAGVIGSITQNGTTAVSYNTSSDYRLKENTQPMSNGLSTINQLKPVTFKWKSDGSDGEGFIAHELQKVIPFAVTGEKDAVDEQGNIKPQGVDYSKIVVHLVAALQEANAKIEALTARVETLEARP